MARNFERWKICYSIPKDNPIGIIWYTWCCFIQILEHYNKVDKVNALKFCYHEAQSFIHLRYS